MNLHAQLDSVGPSAARGTGADQAERLRALVREIVEGKPAGAPPLGPVPLPARQPIISGAEPAHRGADTARAAVLAVASGKGGVGKTTLAVNLSLALSQRGTRVCLIDGDLGLGNADVLLGLNPRRNLAHLLEGSASIEEVLLDCAMRADTAGRGAFMLLPGGSGLADLADLDVPRRARLAQVLRVLESRFDLLLIDCGAGIGASVLSFVRAADAALIVATPEPTAITDAYALIKCLRVGGPEREEPSAGTGPALALVVNQAEDAAAGTAVHQRIESVCARFLSFTPACAGSVRRDRAAGEAVCRRRPVLEVAPSSHAARDIRDLSGFVASLCGLDRPAAARNSDRASAGGGLVARLLRVVTRH